MPTGYTAGINDHTTFEAFTMKCARAMGACLSMKEDPMDKPIPERFEPTDYNQKRHDEKAKELQRVLALSDEEIVRECQADNAEELARDLASKEKAKQIMANYQRMRSMVVAWVPPTDGHQGLKNFMLKQLDQSIDFDCRVYENSLTREEPEVWYEKKVKRLRESIIYHEKEHLEGVTRTEGHNRWLRKLRASLVKEAQ